MSGDEQPVERLDDIECSCGCYRTRVGSGPIWFACEQHGSGSGAELDRSIATLGDAVDEMERCW